MEGEVSNTRFQVSSGLMLEVYPGDEEEPVRIHSRGGTAGTVIIRPEEIDPLIAALLEAGDRLAVGADHGRHSPREGEALKAQGLTPPPSYIWHRG